jgi:hypothetical protein
VCPSTVLFLEIPALVFIVQGIRQRLRGSQAKGGAELPPGVALEDFISRSEARQRRRAKLIPGPLLAMDCVSRVLGE